MYDELRTSCEEELPVAGDGTWSTFSLGTPLKRVISRTSNRIIVGLPLCRRVSFITHTFLYIDKLPAMSSGVTCKFPSQSRPSSMQRCSSSSPEASDRTFVLSVLSSRFLCSQNRFLGKYFSRLPRMLRHANRLLNPLLDERLKMAPEERPVGLLYLGEPNWDLLLIE